MNYQNGGAGMFYLIEAIFFIVVVLFNIRIRLYTSEKDDVLMCLFTLVGCAVFLFINKSKIGEYNTYFYVAGYYLICSIAYSDYKTMQIYKQHLIAIYLIALLSIMRLDLYYVFSHLLCGVLILIMMLVCKKLSKNGVGNGDIKLLTALSVIFGFNVFLRMMLTSLIILIVVSVFNKIFRKKPFCEERPFVPYLSIGLTFTLL